MKAGNVRADGATEANALARLSAVELLEGYRARRFTPRDVIEDVISALELTNASCNVVVTAIYDQARKAADAATAAWSAGRPEGKLTGVPVSIKDLVYVAGVRALGGAPANRDLVPTVDGAVVAALKAAGAIVTCKTTTCESGYKLTADSPVSGVTRNPWNTKRTSGGSSGGAAASIAANSVPLRLVLMWSDQYACRRRSAVWSASSLPSDWSRGRPVFRRRHGRRWRTPDRSRVPSPTRPCFWK